jgi:hypothetical protein
MAKEIKPVTEDQLVLSFCKEKDLGIEGSNEEVIIKFREIYKDQAGLITKAGKGDMKAPRRLRYICELKVITRTAHSA